MTMEYVGFTKDFTKLTNYKHDANTNKKESAVMWCVAPELKPQIVCDILEGPKLNEHTKGEI